MEFKILTGCCGSLCPAVLPHRPPHVHMLSLARPCPATPVCQTHSPELKFAKGNDFCAIPRKILTGAWVIIPGFCLGPRILETMEFLHGEEITPWMDDTSHPGHEITRHCPRMVMPHGLGSTRATEPALEIMNYKKKKKIRVTSGNQLSSPESKVFESCLGYTPGML